VARRLVSLLRRAGVPAGGFTTAELRTAGRREGFLVEAVSGARAGLAHVDLPGPPHDRFTEALRHRPDIRVVRVTEATRDALPEQLIDCLVGTPRGARQ
jgi:nucleoside-triphosphatase THEP1